MYLKIAFYFCLLGACGCAAMPPKAFQGLGPTISQAIFVHPVKTHSIRAVLSAWQKQDGQWRRKFLTSAVIGRNGLAAEGQKREGDGKTPSGIFPLGPAFGDAPFIDTGLSYRQATADDFWVDDIRSKEYNQWVHGQPEARSFEHMRRSDNLYAYGIVIGYNMHPVIVGAGSAIFMHVWRKYSSPTSGCVAISQRVLRKVLRWLNEASKPVILLE